jgi:hypothetical protein
MITAHVKDRLRARIESPALATEVMRRAIKATASYPKGSAAVRLWRDTARHYAGDGSNGECIVLIIRDGVGVTVMFRRDSQPMTRDALRVDATACYRGTCDHSHGR